jgi:hypothetical protein
MCSYTTAPSSTTATTMTKWLVWLTGVMTAAVPVQIFLAAKQLNWF